MQHTLITFATLLLLAGSATAEPLGTAMPTQISWRQAINNPAFKTTALEGGAVANTPDQEDAVIGVYRSGKEFWRWRQGNADLASKNLRDLLKDGEAKTRRLDSAIKGAGTWVILERQGAPVYVGVDDAGAIQSLSLRQQMPIKKGEEDIPAPLHMVRRGEQLFAEYGTPADGTVVITRPNAAIDDQQVLTTMFFKPGQQSPTFNGAWIDGDGASVQQLFARPELKDLAGVKAVTQDAKRVAAIGKELAAGGHFWVDIIEGEDLDLVLYKKGDTKGETYLYTFEGKIYTE
jgi:hypothetical protein